MNTPLNSLQPPLPVLAETALFLDFDGTLSALAARPEQARLAPGLRDRLALLARRMEGRLAIISGRSLDMLDILVGLPGVAMAGIHGLERRTAEGHMHRPEAGPAIAAARADLAAFATAHPQLLLEDKGLGVALHYRQAPWLEAAAGRAAAAAARAHGLALQAGHMVFEVRLPGADKGAALDAFMAQAPFTGHRPLFLGDDLTDEAGFTAAAAHGGHGILVGDRSRQGPPTAARYRLADVEAVALWLGQLAASEPVASL